MSEPTKIVEESDSQLSIEWSDGKSTKFDAAQLRRACPCASCIDEWTGEKILKAESVSSEMTFSKLSLVGRYALSFHFSDGHETGIYSFKFLGKLADNK